MERISSVVSTIQNVINYKLSANVATNLYPKFITITYFMLQLTRITKIDGFR